MGTTNPYGRRFKGSYNTMVSHYLSDIMKDEITILINKGLYKSRSRFISHAVDELHAVLKDYLREGNGEYRYGSSNIGERSKQHIKEIIDSGFTVSIMETLRMAVLWQIIKDRELFKPLLNTTQLDNNKLIINGKIMRVVRRLE